MTRKIIIIGAHAAGLDAASAARKTDRTAEITLITKEDKAAYSRCGLPFVLGGHIETFDDLVVFPERFYKMMKLNLLLETTVTKIDSKEKTVDITYKNGNKEEPQYLPITHKCRAGSREERTHQGKGYSGSQDYEDRSESVPHGACEHRGQDRKDAGSRDGHNPC